MDHVALLRNLNQGQRSHPSADDLLAAFADAGADDAVAFQSNGTIVFSADDPQLVGIAVEGSLSARSGGDHQVFCIPLTEVAAIVRIHSAEADAGRRELTLHRAGVIDIEDPEVVRAAERVRCAIADAGEGWIVTINQRERESNATPVAERLTGAPATSRGLPTLVRLIDRFGRP
ncbi:MAG: DUF1697 domain-containing protein [Microbacterium sp.]